MPSEVKHVPLLHKVQPFGEVHAAEEVFQHGLGLAVAHKLHTGVARDEGVYRGGMVRLHMRNDEVIRRSAAERIGEIFKIRLIHSLVHRVEHGDLIIEHHVRVIRHAIRHAVHALEAGKPPVVSADPDKIIKDFSCAMHKYYLQFLFPETAAHYAALP